MLEVDSILSKCLEIAYKITAKVVECSDELTYSWHVDYRSLKKVIYLQKEKKKTYNDWPWVSWDMKLQQLQLN